MIHLPAGISAVEMQDPYLATAVIDAHGAHVAYCPNEDYAAEIARALNAQMATRKLNPFDPAAPPEPVEIAHHVEGNAAP